MLSSNKYCVRVVFYYCSYISVVVIP